MARKFAELRAQMPVEDQAEAHRQAQEMLAALPLRGLRVAQKLSQQTLAKAMGTTQGEVSKIEQRTDVYVSTLRSYIEAMGGHLNITATFPSGSYEITQFSAEENTPQATTQ
jgi:transcriptional regulator with XRE-family HTH domain